MGLRTTSPAQLDTPGGTSDVFPIFYANCSTVSGSGTSSRRPRAPKVPKASEGPFVYSS
jgi:hypothetical protein